MRENKLGTAGSITASFSWGGSEVKLLPCVTAWVTEKEWWLNKSDSWSDERFGAEQRAAHYCNQNSRKFPQTKWKPRCRIAGSKGKIGIWTASTEIPNRNQSVPNWLWLPKLTARLPKLTSSSYFQSLPNPNSTLVKELLNQSFVSNNQGAGEPDQREGESNQRPVQVVGGKWNGDQEQGSSDWGADKVTGGRELVDGKQFLQEDGRPVREVWRAAKNHHKAKFASDKIFLTDIFESEMSTIQ
jgi:hypothetical protein